jgi:hypothetical protein
MFIIPICVSISSVLLCTGALLYRRRRFARSVKDLNKRLINYEAEGGLSFVSGSCICMSY